MRKPSIAPSGAPTRGPFFSSFRSGCLHRHALHRERQPARRDEGLGALVDQPGLDQPVGDELAQVLGRARLHARGDFLGEQFEQKVGHGITGGGARR